MLTMQNARIESTFLGFEDHGEFTFLLRLDFGGSCQGFGNRANISTEHVKKVIRLLVGDYGNWEGLKGKYIRAIWRMTEVVAVGRLMEDLWLEPGNGWKVGRLEELECYEELMESRQ